MKTENYLSPNLELSGEEAYKYLLLGDYHKSSEFYEKLVYKEPEVKYNYWYLGLSFLLQGEEAEAHTTWLLAMANGTDEEINDWTSDLVQVLKREAERQQNNKDYSVAFLIRQHIKEISPTDINNLLHLVGLSILLEIYNGQFLYDINLINILESGSELYKKVDVDFDLLMQVLKSVLDYSQLDSSSLNFAESCVNYIQEPLLFLELLIANAIEIGYGSQVPELALKFLDIAERLDITKNNQTLNPMAILPHKASFYQNLGMYEEGINTAKECYALSEDLPDKVFANHKILRGLMSAGGYWDEFCTTIEKHKLLLNELVKAPLSVAIHPARVSNLLSTTFFFPYFQDNERENRQFQNQVAKLCENYIQTKENQTVEKYYKAHLQKRNLPLAHRKLKIGYVSHCLLRHSVGWLTRWLFQYHNRDQFEIYSYFVGYRKTPDHLQEWYVSQSDKAYKGGFSDAEIAEQIYEDGIDILVDLDSITLDTTCIIMAKKPAPIQVTWLGWDASGMSAIDYFIADNYVLPALAQDYYSEKIWRLPHCYVSVGGFELGLPTLRREQLNIAGDAIVYLSSQKSYKRNPQTTKLQMKIIKEVPHSYFLIKGQGDQYSLKNFFYQIAEEEGVTPDRLRFISEAPQEQVHRVNLGIADVILDTYPYNGATTTLETLWVGVPLVTRVGEQFSARNSYSMMINAGITEGIAWTDDEYIEWGIRFGKDATLRQQVAWKLWQSRRTAPLWNAQQFACEIETAYQQMWEIYTQ